MLASIGSLAGPDVSFRRAGVMASDYLAQCKVGRKIDVALKVSNTCLTENFNDVVNRSPYLKCELQLSLSAGNNISENQMEVCVLQAVWK
jgi:hypothetical protein